MKFLCLCFLTVVCPALAGQWDNFKRTYGKTYSPEEENFRKEIFLKNLKLIEQHNRGYREGRSTFLVGINKFADYTKKELFLSSNTRSVSNTKQSIPTSTRYTKSFIPKREVPDSIDWRDYGVISPIPNQELCQSCWAFAVVGTIEAHMGIYHQQNVSLSQQNLVDCVDPTFNCNREMERDMIDRTYQYITENQGIDTYESYPIEYYTVGECRYKEESCGAKIAAYANVTEGDEEELKAVVGTIGPVTVAVTTDWSWSMYVGGVYYKEDCMDVPEIFNHAVVVVGYGSEDGQDYWIVKNSWGDYFGEEGYIRMARNRDNNCGIATIARYPLM